MSRFFLRLVWALGRNEHGEDIIDRDVTFRRWDQAHRAQTSELQSQVIELRSELAALKQKRV